MRLNALYLMLSDMLEIQAFRHASSHSSPQRPQLTFCTSPTPSSRVSATFPESIFNIAGLIAFGDCTFSHVVPQMATRNCQNQVHCQCQWHYPVLLPILHQTVHLSQVNVLLIPGRFATLSPLSMHMTVQFIYELLR